MVEALHHRGGGKPPLDHFAAGVAGILEHLQHAICRRPVVHRVDHKFSGHQARVEAHELVKRDSKHYDVGVVDCIRCPSRLSSRYDHLGDQRDPVWATGSCNRHVEARIERDSRHHRPNMTGAKHRDSLCHVRAAR